MTTTPNIAGSRSASWNTMTVQDGKTGYMELLFPWQQPGTGLFRIDENGNVTAASVSGGLLELQAATPLAGYTMVNSTGTIISWTAPNDGKMHRVAVFGMQEMTSGGTGGVVNLDFTDPGGTTHAFAIFAANAGLGGHAPGLVTTVLVAPGTVVKVAQDSALTAGAGIVWAEIWGL
jgi:hypothetical protein